MDIYFAGKVSKNGWREEIFDVRSNSYFPNEWPDRVRIKDSQHYYVGPFMKADDHGFAHGKNTHGANGVVNTDSGMRVYETVYPGENNLRLMRDRKAFESDLYNSCVGAIKRADAIFAFIDSSEAFGTYYEIGIAKALGKLIFITYKKDAIDPDDFWFMNYGCLNEKYIFDNAKSAFDFHFPKPKIDEFSSFVYLLKMEGTNYYKIGYTTNNPLLRIKSLQTGNPKKIELVYAYGFTYNSINVEAKLHNIFVSSKTNGGNEWFAISESSSELNIIDRLLNSEGGIKCMKGDLEKDQYTNIYNANHLQK